MTEKEMIEEMCKNFKCCVNCEMFGGYVDGNDELKNCSCVEDTDHCTQCYISTRQAKVLIKEGYRKGKLPEGAVVLDRHEAQKYFAYKHIESQIKGCLDRERELEKQIAELEEQRDRQAYIAEELIQEKHRWTEQARKEMAKEILKELMGHTFEDDGWTWTIVSKDDILRLADKYGVKVEE